MFSLAAGNDQQLFSSISLFSAVYRQHMVDNSW